MYFRVVGKHGEMKLLMKAYVVKYLEGWVEIGDGRIHCGITEASSRILPVSAFYIPLVRPHRTNALQFLDCSTAYGLIVKATFMPSFSTIPIGPDLRASGGLPAISVYLNHDLLPQSDKSMLREVSIN